MNFNRIQLQKGVHLNIIETDKSKMNGLLVSMILPVTSELASSASLLSRVLRRGTVSYPSMMDISCRLCDLYGADVSIGTSKKGEALLLNFSASALRNNYTFDDSDVFSEVLDVLHEMIYNPYIVDGKLSKQYIESEKKNLKDAIHSQIDNKSSYAIKRCIDYMCKDEPFAISSMGDVNIIDAVDSDSLLQTLNHFINEAVIEIFFAGIESTEHIVETVRSKLPFKARNANLPSTCLKLPSVEAKQVCDQMEVTQGKLCIGFRTPITLVDSDYIKFALFNEIYGGGCTSKLFMNVREKLSLCYYCQTIPEPHKGILLVTSGVEFENFQKAEKAIFKELEAIVNGEITEEELSNAKKSLINGYKEIDDSPASMCLWYLSRVLAGRTDSPSDAANLVNELTIDDIMQTAKTLHADTIYYLKGDK